MPKNKKFLLIDSNALVHRAFHAIPNLRTRDGRPIGAVYGFTSTLLKAIEDTKPDYIAATFDMAGPTFRHEEYADYKATRVKAPDELYEQIPMAQEVLVSLNIPIFELQGFEADDIIGTLCAKIDEKNLGVDTYIVTGDMDTLQLVDDNTFVYTLKKGIKDTIVYDEKGVVEKMGLTPSQVVDYKALRGDASDNIPGVKGIGEKTATDLLQKYQTLDSVYEAVGGKDFGFSDAVKEKLLADKENAYLSQKLATINREAPIKLVLPACELTDVDFGKATATFQKFEFRSLMPRLLKLMGEGSKSVSKQDELTLFDKKLKKEEIKKLNNNYILVNDQRSFGEFLKELKKQKEFAIDTETSALGALDSELVGLSFSWKAGEGYYIPVGHSKGQQLPKKSVLETLRPILENEKIKKIGQNIKYDMLAIRKAGVKMTGIYFDTMLASYCLDPVRRGHSLDNMAFIEFGHQMIPITALIGAGAKQKSFAETDVNEATEYAAEDADFTWRLYEVLKGRLTGKTNDLFYDVEMPLLSVLADMEWWGVRIDAGKLKEISQVVAEKIKKSEKQIHQLAGEDFNIASPQQLAEVLFKKLKISSEFVKKNKTGLSTAAGELEKLKGAHPIIEPILEYRELTKLQNTYLEALPKAVNPMDGRIHTNFSQTIAATGRLSSIDPNLQNIPASEEWGQQIRSAFVAEKGHVLIKFDYSQIELRVVAHLSGDKKMLQAFRDGRDIHAETAQAVFGVSADKVTKEQRRTAKVVNFGILYGMSAFGLSQSIGVSPTEAKEFIDQYFENFSGVRDYLNDTIEFAKEHGHVETLLGRRRPTPDILSPVVQVRKAAERMAINMPIQGTAADIIKLAMIEIDRQILSKNSEVKMILQVHDELVFEIPDGKISNHPVGGAGLKSQISKIMENVLELKCPLIVDTKEGKNWGM
ncbi:DNA polymerase I [Candidatus Microgenomates bacterium]|nr:DNA polymerase I [Candidatus Microgenomates bacterium]